MKFYQMMPKIELHLHLEGAIPYAVLFDLIQKYGGEAEIKSAEDIAKKFVFRDFKHFIELWIWKNNFLREYEDFRLIAENVALDLKSQNVKYAEIFISPSPFKRCGLSCAGIIEAAAEGFKAAGGIRISIIVDMVRDNGLAEALSTLDEIEEARRCGIIGIGLGGSENEHPPSLFPELFEKARNMGFKTSVHSGEVSGAASVDEAVKLLRPDRIGHCVGAAIDGALLKRIVESNISVELCPISNLRTGAIKAAELYPLDKFVESGINFSINTDDPKMFGNSLVDEYYLIDKKLGFGRSKTVEFILNSISGAWISAEDKKTMREEFEKEIEIIKKNCK